MSSSENLSIRMLRGNTGNRAITTRERVGGRTDGRSLFGALWQAQETTKKWNGGGKKEWSFPGTVYNHLPRKLPDILYPSSAVLIVKLGQPGRERRRHKRPGAWRRVRPRRRRKGEEDEEEHGEISQHLRDNGFLCPNGKGWKSFLPVLFD